ncbi:hypothetical protein PFISCL1PPCAC_6536, partial [Pristionchus fissidentatus]
GSEPFECPTGTHLQVKKNKNSEFEVAIEVNCTKNQCMINGVSGVPEKLRCVKRKCSTCPDPCPGRNRTHFTTAWNECSSIRCNSSSVTLIRRPTGNLITDSFECVSGSTQADSIWKSSRDNEQISINDNIHCLDELLCTAEMPLMSYCIDGDFQCEKVKFDNHADVYCPQEIGIRKQG